MRQMCRALRSRVVATGCFLLATSMSSSFAQERAPVAEGRAIRAPEAVLSPSMVSGVTGKERLGEKWTDEQRVDNCKVPPDRRGSRPRPDTCPSFSAK